MHLPKLYYLSAQAFLMENTKKTRQLSSAPALRLAAAPSVLSCVRDPQSGARALAAAHPR